MKNGTPIYDIKPYIAYADCKPDAKSSFADIHKNDKLTVKINDELKVQIPNNKLSALIGILECDPRPAYQNDESRIYGISFANMNIKNYCFLTVVEVQILYYFFLEQSFSRYVLMLNLYYNFPFFCILQSQAAKILLP